MLFEHEPPWGLHDLKYLKSKLNVTLEKYVELNFVEITSAHKLDN